MGEKRRGALPREDPDAGIFPDSPGKPLRKRVAFFGFLLSIAGAPSRQDGPTARTLSEDREDYNPLEPCSHRKNEPLITLERVTLRMGDRMLLPGTSWEIKSGENWAILGPNGSGKSALAGAVRGDVPHVRGKLTRHDPEAEGSRIGYVSFELQEELLAREERREEARSFSGRGHDLTAGELLRENDGDPAALNRIADALDLHPLLGHGFRTLSNGEIRKLLIARALLPSPKLLILDDPFAGLDAGSRRSLAAAVTKLMEEGTQILLVAQRPEEVIPGISHVLLIRNGRVARIGKREEVLTPARMRLFQGKGESLPALRPPPGDAGKAPRPFGDPLVEMRNVRVAYGRGRRAGRLELDRPARGELGGGGPQRLGKIDPSEPDHGGQPAGLRQ